MNVAKCRGVVLLVFDTLRKDFNALCTAEGVIDLTEFPRLQALTIARENVRCGSFPTVPMRTDLLVGRLAFLDQHWATPLSTDTVLTIEAAKQDIRTALVTDNYVIMVPRLGGKMTDFVQTFEFIRGAGSDPWMIPKPVTQWHGSNRPARSIEFELQYCANAEAWECNGGTPETKLFAAAARHLKAIAKHDKFFLWVDCFSAHEPWMEPNQLVSNNHTDDEVISPPYGSSNLYSSDQLQVLRRQYVKRIASIDRAMRPFTEVLLDVMRTGDVALCILSDHGFLFGEYGLVGKPSYTPVFPILHDLVAWFSPHFGSLHDTTPPMQPHCLWILIGQILGISTVTEAATQETARDSGLQIIGRNSPDSPCISIAFPTGMLVLFRDDVECPPRWYPWDTLDPIKPWEEQGMEHVPEKIFSFSTYSTLAKLFQEHWWTRRFLHGLNFLRR